MTDREVFGRPAAHFVARLAAMPDNMLLLRHGYSFLALRPYGQGFMRQTLAQDMRPAALIKALAKSSTKTGIYRHATLLHPAPEPSLDGPTGPSPHDDSWDTFRLDAARAVRAAAGIPSKTFLATRHGALVTSRTGIVHTTTFSGSPISLGLLLFHRQRRCDDLVEQIWSCLPEGSHLLRGQPSAHDRLRLGISQEILAGIDRQWPGDTLIRFVRQGPALAVFRAASPEGRHIPLLFALRTETPPDNTISNP